MTSPFLARAASVLLNTHTSWPVESLRVTMFRDIAGTQPVLVDLCDFVKEVPDHLQQMIEHDEKLYFPPAVTATTTTAVSDIEQTNVHDYLNAESCHDNGYKLSSNGRKRGKSKYPCYGLVCQGHGRTFRATVVDSYKYKNKK